jgi:hypothetical protein
MTAEVDEDDSDSESDMMPPIPRLHYDNRWLVHFIAIAIFLGLLAILAITLLSMG